MVDLGKLKTLGEWHEHRDDLIKKVTALIGSPPRDRTAPQAKVVDEKDFPRYTRKRINYFVDEWTRVSAWLFVPSLKEEMPAILCCHSRVAEGKDEPAGVPKTTPMATAQIFAERGYVTLAPDCITAGERQSGEAYDSTAYYKEKPKVPVIGKMLADHMHGIDALAEVNRVDMSRVAVMGHGLGGTNALLLAAFDERIAACVASCGFTRMETDKHLDRWVNDEGLSLMPGLEGSNQAGGPGFDWEHVMALAAPTALLVLTALSNAAYDNPKSCQKAVGQAGRVYKMLGTSSAIEHFGHHDGHTLSSLSLEMAEDWFDRWV